MRNTQVSCLKKLQHLQRLLQGKMSGRYISASAAEQRAPEYVRKGKVAAKETPAKKASVKRPTKRTIHLIGRKTSMFEDPEEAEEEAPEEI